MGASYFGNSKLQAIHIDLMPYTTMSDFNEIMNLCRNDIFMDNWGNKMIIKLIELMNPQCLVIFGRNNLNHFNSLFTDLNIGNPVVLNIEKANNEYAKCSYWSFDFYGISAIGLSVNLGNPKGFDKQALHQLGQKIKSII